MKKERTGRENDQSGIAQSSLQNNLQENLAKSSEADEKMIDEILAHLDKEIALGAARMSVLFDDNMDEEKAVSHKCCMSYGRPATETVGLLDMYTDISAGKPDRNADN
jgi:hypothetical protein